jgi:segregation and condensation protein B
MDQTEIKHFVEAALLAAGRPLNIDQLKGLFDGRMAPEKSEIRTAIATLNEEYEPRGIVVAEVASGFRMQIKQGMADRLQKLWEDRPPRYSRALFETLALVAYRQPITRGEIEEVRGVSVSPNITRTLMERDWVRVVGHRDVPGRPEMFGTTKRFLDYFGLKKLEDLPPLADLSDWESLRVQLDLPDVEKSGETEGAAENIDIPLLQPEGEQDEAEPKPEQSEVAEDDIPRLQPEESLEDIEQLVVSEWPDP